MRTMCSELSLGLIRQTVFLGSQHQLLPSSSALLGLLASGQCGLGVPSTDADGACECDGEPWRVESTLAYATWFCPNDLATRPNCGAEFAAEIPRSSSEFDL